MFGQYFLEKDSSIQNSDSIRIVPKNVNMIYFDRIKSVRLKALNSKYREAVISIYPSSKLELSFDDLNDDFTEYHFEIFYCDKDWNTEDKSKNEYYESFISNSLEDYSFSSATKTDYTHYTLILPRDGEKFLKSGNYIIHIIETESDSIILTRRFMVINPMINISGEVSRTDDVKYADYRQQIKFEIYDPKSVLEDIGQIYIRISKNSSWDIECNNIKPSFVNNDRITFERSDACTFDGGNEYRFFNMIDFRNISNNIVRVKIEPSGIFNLWLDYDSPRSFLQYSATYDFNGNTLYTSDVKFFNANELDYAWVNFRLKPDEVMLSYEIYIYGELSDFRLQEDFKMNYNSEKDIYELRKLLKQGLYNYQYVVKSIYQEGPDEVLLEGSHYETENNYTIYVYYSNTFEGEDQLLGIERINSRKKLDK